LDKQKDKRKISVTKFDPHKKTDIEIALHFLQLLDYPHRPQMEWSHEFVNELIVIIAKKETEKMKNPFAKKLLRDGIEIYLATGSCRPK